MDDDKIFDKIDEVGLKKTMERSYIDYAMSVIAARALPDVRDGLKPVQRRILHSMIELNNGPDKPHRKCARIVGDTSGIPDIHLWMDMETLDRSTVTMPLPCDIQRQDFPRYPWR